MTRVHSHDARCRSCEVVVRPIPRQDVIEQASADVELNDVPSGVGEHAAGIAWPALPDNGLAIARAIGAAGGGGNETVQIAVIEVTRVILHAISGVDVLRVSRPGGRVRVE